MILLAEGARIMITRNLWTSKGTVFCLVFKLVPQFYLGLVNGSQGIVKKIWYQPQDDPKTHKLPAVVFVECPGYSGMYVCLHIQTLSDKYTRSSYTRLAWG